MKNTNNNTFATLETLTVPALKEMCKKLALSGYSKLKKIDLVNLIVATKESRKQAKQEAMDRVKEEAKLALGADYAKAVLFFKEMREVKHLGIEDYDRIVGMWKILSALAGNQVQEYSVDAMADYFRRLFNPEAMPSMISKMTHAEKVEYVDNYISIFAKNTVTLSHTKASYTIIKMALTDLSVDQNGNVVFDSSRAVDLSADTIGRNEGVTMRKVKTAEDGLYRVIKTHKGPDYEATYALCIARGMNDEQAQYEAMGLPQVSIDLNIEAEDETAEGLKSLKRKVFEDGFTDINTGYHYMFLKQTPSESRKGTATFIYANSWAEIYELWYEFTGLGNYEAFRDAFGTDKGVVFSKLLTRIASRGSNSFASMKLYDEAHKEAIKHTRVLFVPDRKITFTRAQKEFDGESTNLVLNDNGAVNLTLGDGMSLFSNRYCALNAGGMKMITGNEEHLYLDIWEQSNHDITVAQKSPAFRKIEAKIPAVWQIRGGCVDMQSMKGTGVKCFFEDITVELTAELANELNKLNGTAFVEGETLCLGNYDVICPESVAKFMTKGEVANKEFNLEICNYLKRKGEWVCMNPQFFAALSSKNPNAITPILKFWIDQITESFDDIAKMEHLMNIIAYSNDNEDVTYDDITDDDAEIIKSVDLSTVLVANSKLASDPQVLNMVKDKIVKFLHEMRVGRVRVPGVYTYMIQDPNALLNAYFGLELPQLGHGEFYFNNKDCRCGLFRSPLIAPFEAQKVQLVQSDLYWAYKDVIVLNACDGVWDLMGGCDFDGDTCAVVPDDDANGFGKIIVDAIRDNEIPVYEEARSAKKTIWSPDDNTALIDFLCSIGRDRTGEITNYATRLLDISNHFYGLKFFAEHYGCDTVEFLSPEVFGANGNYAGKNYGPFGMDFTFAVKNKTFLTKGIVKCVWNNESKKHSFLVNEPGAIIGQYTVAQLEALAEDKMKLVEVLRLLQGEEIDGAKTGYHPVVEEEFQCKINPHWLITRQSFLGRLAKEYDEHNKEIAEPAVYTIEGFLGTVKMPKFKKYNVFHSFSMMGRIHDYTWQAMQPILARFEQGTDKMTLLKGLMTDAELNALKVDARTANGEIKSLMAYIRDRKDAYNESLYNLRQQKLNEEDSKSTIANLKYQEAKALCNLANAFGISLETIACGAYLATYDKDGKNNTGLSYAWILWPELVSVFSRDNASFELFKLPDSAESAYVLDGILYVDGQKYMPVKAKNGDVLVQRFGGTKAFGLLHKDNGTAVVSAPVRVSGGAEYEIGVYGFGYANRDAKTLAEWKQMVKENNYVFHIVDDGKGALCTAIIDEDGTQHILAQVMLKDKSVSNIDLELLGKKVTCKVTSPNYKDTDKNGNPARSISGLRVRVIG